jgi:histone deacetylase 1/2
MKENIQILKAKFKLGEEGDLCDYLGKKITKRPDGTIILTQPQLITSILEDLNLLASNAKGRKTPALSSVILTEDQDGASFDNSFHRSVIGKLNYLEKSTRPELAYTVHQCARLCTQPKRSHAKAVKHIGRYLLSTKNLGIILKPKQGTFDCWVDASHAGEWNKLHAESDPVTAKSRTGYVIMFEGCPLVWASKLQTEIALSSTEAEYIALSTATREIIPLLDFLKEAKEKGIPIDVHDAAIQCKIFENNSGAIEMAKVPKMRPRTKHLNIKYHFFRQHVQAGLLSVHAVKTEEQIADIFTKPLSEELFQTHHRSIIGW